MVQARVPRKDRAFSGVPLRLPRVGSAPCCPAGTRATVNLRRTALTLAVPASAVRTNGRHQKNSSTACRSGLVSTVVLSERGLARDRTDTICQRRVALSLYRRTEETVMTACNVDNLSIDLSIGRAEGPAGDNSNRFSISRQMHPAEPCDPNSRICASK